ncbi:recombination and repair protein RecT [compost metagenome]
MSQTTSLADLKKTSKMVASQAGIGQVKAFMESQKATLAAVLPRHVSPDRMLKIALGALRTTPKLMGCTVESLMGAVVQCSQLGLEPNTPLGHAYLIPFEKRKKQGNEWVTDKIEVQIVLGYRGLIDLARRSGQIVSIAAQAVYENDHFEYAYGLDEKLEHRPAMGERGAIIAFYAVAKLAGGGHAFEVMSDADVTRIRDASQGWQQAVRAKKQDTSPWGAHYAEMGRKTVLRRLFKYLPVSIELANAASLDELNARGESQALDNVLEGDYITPAPGDDADDAPVNAPAFDPAPILQMIAAAADIDALALAGEAFRDAPDEHYDALKKAYDNRRAELEPAA